LSTSIVLSDIYHSQDFFLANVHIHLNQNNSIYIEV